MDDNKLIDEIMSKTKEMMEIHGWYFHSVIDENGNITDVHTHGLDEITKRNSELNYNPHINFRYLNNNNYEYVLDILRYLVSQVQDGDIFDNNHTFDYNNEMFILFKNIDNFGELVLDIKRLDD